MSSQPLSQNKQVLNFDVMCLAFLQFMNLTPFFQLFVKSLNRKLESIKIATQTYKDFGNIYTQPWPTMFQERYTKKEREKDIQVNSMENGWTSTNRPQ